MPWHFEGESWFDRVWSVSVRCQRCETLHPFVYCTAGQAGRPKMLTFLDNPAQKGSDIILHGTPGDTNPFGNLSNR